MKKEKYTAKMDVDINGQSYKEGDTVWAYPADAAYRLDHTLEKFNSDDAKNIRSKLRRAAKQPKAEA